jgi:hypothetical protein
LGLVGHLWEVIIIIGGRGNWEDYDARIIIWDILGVIKGSTVFQQ